MGESRKNKTTELTTLYQLFWGPHPDHGISRTSDNALTKEMVGYFSEPKSQEIEFEVLLVVERHDMLHRRVVGLWTLEQRITG